MAKGRMIYVPPLLIGELDNVMKEESLTIKAEGLNKIANYSRIGRETLNKKRDLPHIPLNFNRKRLRL